MDLPTMVYENYLASHGYTKAAWAFLRKVLIRFFNDPTCFMLVHDRKLNVRLSHALPLYLSIHALYDRLPARISKYIHSRKSSLNCIDVGANIGDTIAAFYINDSDKFLAIEPNQRFFNLLAKNWEWNRNVTLISTLCSSSSGEGTFAIQETSGTASISEAASDLLLRKMPLDAIVAEHPDFGHIDVIKIDTDGHDFEVIKGSITVLSEQQPIVLWECDAFDNANYVENCIEIFEIFRKCGYNQFLVYDNFGYLMGRYALDHIDPVRHLLFFQLTSPFYYFDILVMKDEDLQLFHKSEIDFFVGRMSNKLLQQTAIAAATP